jgi:hypothetical protein
MKRIVVFRSRGRHASRDHVLWVEELWGDVSFESLKLPKLEVPKSLIAD